MTSFELDLLDELAARTRTTRSDAIVQACLTNLAFARATRAYWDISP